MKYNFFNSFLKKQKQYFVDKTNKNEDKTVLKFLESLCKSKKFKYLEVGSGRGRFPLKITTMFENIDIECFEINQDLAKITSENGLATSIGDAINLPYKSESFDILHCSHVVEHFKYPEITQLLDQLFRVTKQFGYVIIRSPLLHPGFYLDIDHVRPYPPETILNYFKNTQQQKVGQANVKMIKCWYRRENCKIYNIESAGWKYLINAFLAFSWSLLGIPFSKKNGYVLILQKL